MLGLIGGTATINFHGRGNSSDFISVNCTGEEESIADCEYSTAQIADCNDVAVICLGI